MGLSFHPNLIMEQTASVQFALNTAYWCTHAKQPIAPFARSEEASRWASRLLQLAARWEKSRLPCEKQRRLCARWRRNGHVTPVLISQTGVEMTWQVATSPEMGAQERSPLTELTSVPSRQPCQVYPVKLVGRDWNMKNGNNKHLKINNDAKMALKGRRRRHQALPTWNDGSRFFRYSALDPHPSFADTFRFSLSHFWRFVVPTNQSRQRMRAPRSLRQFADDVLGDFRSSVIRPARGNDTQNSAMRDNEDAPLWLSRFSGTLYEMGKYVRIEIGSGQKQMSTKFIRQLPTVRWGRSQMSANGCRGTKNSDMFISYSDSFSELTHIWEFAQFIFTC